MLEIGRPPIACRGEVLILIGLRAGQPGLCYQHVNRRYVPFGKVKSIPWEAIATVDATDEVDAPKRAGLSMARPFTHDHA